MEGVNVPQGDIAFDFRLLGRKAHIPSFGGISSCPCRYRHIGVDGRGEQLPVAIEGNFYDIVLANDGHAQQELNPSYVVTFAQL